LRPWAASSKGRIVQGILCPRLFVRDPSSGHRSVHHIYQREGIFTLYPSSVSLYAPTLLYLMFTFYNRDLYFTPFSVHYPLLLLFISPEGPLLPPPHPVGWPWRIGSLAAKNAQEKVKRGKYPRKFAKLLAKTLGKEMSQKGGGGGWIPVVQAQPWSEASRS